MVLFLVVGKRNSVGKVRDKAESVFALQTFLVEVEDSL